ncbi:MAG: glycogen-debranching protein, partial [Pseudomonadota bacterium]|nr:glycogen-debranching protein [Pseudomonadota bacterium]
MRLTLCRAGLALAAVAFCLSAPARGAINSMNLCARYDATKANIAFQVYSSRATRIELDIYATPSGAQEAARYVMTKGANNVWSANVVVGSIQAQGVTGAVYYGYRAWGPNWPYNSAWVKGSSSGFISDVDSAGNRFNPNKLLFDPYALEISHDPLNPNSTDGTVYASGASYRTI